MENANRSAFGFEGLTSLAEGLTKREYFAVHIATGLSVQAIAGRHNLAENMVKEVPAIAVLIADALLEELNKTK
jgi:DNA-binding CsgD family transcriptional regulator